MKALSYTLLRYIQEQIAQSQKESMKSIIAKAVIEDSTSIIVLICSLFACLVGSLLGLSFILMASANLLGLGQIESYLISGIILIVVALFGLSYIKKQVSKRVLKYKNITETKHNVTSLDSVQSIFEPLTRELKVEHTKMKHSQTNTYKSQHNDVHPGFYH